MDTAPGFPERFRHATALAGFGDERGWQQRIADELGVKNQAIGQWMRGETLPSSTMMLKISQRFGCSLDWLLLNRGRIYPGDGVSEEEMGYIAKRRTLTTAQQALVANLLDQLQASTGDRTEAA